MASDVEDEVTLSHKTGIKPVHASLTHRVAVVDDQRTSTPDGAPPALPDWMTRSLRDGRHRDRPDRAEGRSGSDRRCFRVAAWLLFWCSCLQRAFFPFRVRRRFCQGLGL